MLAALLLAVNDAPLVVRADPIDPPEGYPKLNLSAKTVMPALATTGGVTLTYRIEIQNTGAHTATGATLTDVFPQNTTYNSDAWASAPTITVTGSTLTWVGDVGFDSTVVVTFSVMVNAAYSGTLHNTAVISHPLVADPITTTAETVVTDHPILVIEKRSAPDKPGANKPLTYTIIVANMGQPMTGTITVTERIPPNTTALDVGGGVTNANSTVITWTRSVTMNLRDEETFTFSVLVGDVISGRVISNTNYTVDSSETGVTSGEPYTVTIVDPILFLSKHVWPDPPGSNREMTYTLTLFNMGSLATGLVITDRVPDTVSYTRGGAYSSGVVSWSLPNLDTGESAELAYTVYISDVMGIPIVNDDYAACCTEGVCQPGDVLTSVVAGPTFETWVVLDPIAKKPGGGGGPVTPTLTVRNIGPGNAIDAMALLQFGRISVSANDLYADPAIGTLPPFPSGPDCGDKCVSYVWVGDLALGEMITFTTVDPQSTIGGEEGTHYTATVIITDALSNMDTEPITGTAIGKITHMAYLNVYKDAATVIGRGQILTYTINVWNSALSTDEPPPPFLWDILPISGTTLITSSISHSGTVQSVLTGSLQMQVISWTLPAFTTGERMEEPRTFAVRVNDDLVSGTKVINNYQVHWYEAEDDEIFVSFGGPITTTVMEVGLIDSFKEVTPALALPGQGNVLTYYLHIVNSSPLSLTDVTVYDHLPWLPSTYQRDAVASAGDVVSDIVSVQWTGDVDAFSSKVVTLTVLVDEDYRGPVTNTAVISHPDLLDEVVVEAVAYITEKPVLRITKKASPDPVEKGGELLYTIRVINLGQQATSLIISDTIPANTTYITDSATGGGQLVGDEVRWENISALDPGASRSFAFRVTVEGGAEVVNEQYIVRCHEGVIGAGEPVVTRITGGGNMVYLPLVLKNY
ncbi:MAG: hypothetical protein U9R15_20865 [Chloroflexota bacterium]|nr:hypothetical protein [Chloroflexota bacterium]